MEKTIYNQNDMTTYNSNESLKLVMQLTKVSIKIQLIFG